MHHLTSPIAVLTNRKFQFSLLRQRGSMSARTVAERGDGKYCNVQCSVRGPALVPGLRSWIALVDVGRDGSLEGNAGVNSGLDGVARYGCGYRRIVGDLFGCVGEEA
jgi:hypothetical protein